MKKFFVLMVFISFCILYMYAGTGKCMVSEDSAVKIVKDLFPEKDYDYYIVEDNDSINWTIFVDAVPLANWEHLCYTYSVKRTLGADEILEATNEQVRKLPPSFRIRPHNLKDRFKNAPKYKAVVNERPLESINTKVAERTFAIILSGGIEVYGNFERYWNDCSFIYKTLRKRYGIPKNNIWPIMSDGNDPAIDQWSADGGYVSQSLDLDADGLDDIELAATRENIQNTIQNINNLVKEGDHFFLFVIDHGGFDKNTGHSYICLWGRENYLYDYELAELIRPITQKGAFVNVVLGQCYSGGFIDDLTMDGCVVTTACKEDEPSNFLNRYYDEFVFNWTTAINGGVPSSLDSLAMDLNQQGKITMKNAYDFAKYKGSLREHPQYSSYPSSLGKELSFNYIPPTVDIIIKDNYNDYGEETEENKVWWNSPSIYARHKNDSIPVHENITLKKMSKAFIYVKIHNRGIKKYKGDDICRLYWSLASTNTPNNIWVGEDNSSRDLKGGLISSKMIPEIEAGDSTVLTFEWNKPTLMKETGNMDFLDKDTKDQEVMFLATIDDTKKGYDYTLSNYSNSAHSNKIAEKNQSTIDLITLSKFSKILVRNTLETSKTISLELCPESEKDLLLFDKAKIGLRFPDEIYQALTDDNLPNKFEQDKNTINFSKEKTVINNIPVQSNKEIEIGLKVTYFKTENDNDRYKYHLIQKDSRGNIMGGMALVIEKPSISINEPLNIQLAERNNDTKEVYVDSDSISSLIWLDQDDEFIDDKRSILIGSLKTETSFKVAALNSDGSLSTGQIVIPKDTGIKNISSLSNFNNEIDVEFYSPCEQETSLVIISTTNGEIKSSNQVQTGSINTSISVSDLERGIYSLIYMTGNEVIDSIKFTKK